MLPGGIGHTRTSTDPMHDNDEWMDVDEPGNINLPLNLGDDEGDGESQEGGMRLMKRKKSILGLRMERVTTGLKINKTACSTISFPYNKYKFSLHCQSNINIHLLYNTWQSHYQIKKGVTLCRMLIYLFFD